LIEVTENNMAYRDPETGRFVTREHWYELQNEEGEERDDFDDWDDFEDFDVWEEEDYGEEV
jgi:hypothetical protein